eukprot:3145152-Pleurochrysis_carterae.AAC.2
MRIRARRTRAPRAHARACMCMCVCPCSFVRGRARDYVTTRAEADVRASALACASAGACAAIRPKPRRLPCALVSHVVTCAAMRASSRMHVWCDLCRSWIEPDQTTSAMFPNEARLRNLTYAALARRLECRAAAHSGGICVRSGARSLHASSDCSSLSPHLHPRVCLGRRFSVTRVAHARLGLAAVHLMLIAAS